MRDLLRGEKHQPETSGMHGDPQNDFMQNPCLQEALLPKEGIKSSPKWIRHCWARSFGTQAFLCRLVAVHSIDTEQ